MKLSEALDNLKFDNSTKDILEREKELEGYKLECKLHWHSNREKILRFLAAKKRVKGKIFMPYMGIHDTPFTNIPIFKKIDMPYDDEQPGAIDTLMLYLQNLGFNVKEKGSTCFSTTDKNCMDNGVLIYLNSDIHD
ncbi:MAG: hypothetical protein N2749_05470 [Clostridia bacterium]|nr:hypothetical protein [Clostridia bacterium]